MMMLTLFTGNARRQLDSQIRFSAEVLGAACFDAIDGFGVQGAVVPSIWRNAVWVRCLQVKMRFSRSTVVSHG